MIRHIRYIRYVRCFPFFLKATALHVAATPRGNAAADGTPTIDRVEFDVQATVSSGGAYDPLLPDGTWPQVPLWAQLHEGKEMETANVDVEDYYGTWSPPKQTAIAAGADFDQLLLGIPVSTLSRPLGT